MFINTTSKSNIWFRQYLKISITKQVDSFIFDRWWIFDRQFFNWIFIGMEQSKRKNQNNLKETNVWGTQVGLMKTSIS
jgi:hypothetical protein